MMTRTLMLLAATLLSSSLPSLAQSTVAPKAKADARSATTAQKGAWEKIPAPPLPPFKPVEPIRIQLSNGMVIFLSEDHELPLIEATMRIRGGSREEPAAKVGMLDIYGDVWRTGGTKSKTGDELDDVLEARAAKIETDDNADSTTIALSCLKQDFDTVFETYVDVLRNPAFRDEKIELAKEEMKSTIARRNDNISAIAGREGAKLAFGKNNPYVRTPEYATVDAVKREDLVAWHDQHVSPNNIIFGMVGDFDSKQMEQKLRAAFESWPKGPEAPPFHAEFKTAAPGIYFVNKEDVNQSEIRIVGLGIRRDNPDYYAVEVMNQVFGGGFSSRLFSRIRTAQGLAYAVYGSIGSAFDHPGAFHIGMGTKSVTTVEAIQSLNAQIDDLVKTPPTAEELHRAKDAILNSFIFNFDTPEKVLREKMAYEFYHYPLDFLERYRANIEKITSDDVARVARKYVHKEQMPVLVVGNDKEMGAQKLSLLGPVTPIDISIPESGSTASEIEAAPQASNPEGKQLVSQFVQAMGGKEKLASVKGIQQTASTVRNSPQGEITISVSSFVEYPDRVFSELGTPMGSLSMAAYPGGSYMVMGNQSSEMPPPTKEDALKSLKRDVIAVAQHTDDPKYTFTAAGMENVNGVKANVLKLNADGAQATWYLDPKTHLPLRSEFSSTGQNGPVNRVVDYSDWKSFDGVNLYTARTVSDNGKVTSKDSIKEWKINPKIDPAIWQAPKSAASADGDQPK